MNVGLSPQHGLCQYLGRIQLVEIRTQATNKTTAQLLLVRPSNPRFSVMRAFASA